MHFLTVTLLVSSALLTFAIEQQQYSFSEQVGTNRGTVFSLTGTERITGVRTWTNGNYIYGLQLGYGGIWSKRVGSTSTQMQEFLLHDDEAIVQVSGMYSTYINGLVFGTNKGRSMFNGPMSGLSFNMYPEYEGAELRFISGATNAATSGPLTGFAAHWALFIPETNSTEH
ncbi:zymogen granule membrane protein 16-like [Eucyclogobius newberryi]|uniref:zymogen granule membrane protein 16-like n=1 Tax=Eucyclogobius newberryi TaxID=166745 RepID=UPI003B594368